MTIDTTRRDIIDTYRAEYGPEMGDDWRMILLDMAAMADGHPSARVRYACEIASDMPTREAAITVLKAAEGNNAGLIRRVLGLA